MDSRKRSSVTPQKSRLVRTISKVLHLRGATGVTPVDRNQKVNPKEKKAKDNTRGGNRTRSVSRSFKEQDEDEKRSNRAAKEALLAKLFASLSTFKAAYAQLQVSQFPYDADEIESSDQIIVSQLQTLSELKQCFIKKQFDFPPESAMALAEIQEQKSVVKNYEILAKKLESQSKLKDSEITFLEEKLDECNKQNRSIDKRLNSSGSLQSVPENLHLSLLNPRHFITVHQNMIKSIRGFVRVMVNEIKSTGWDIDAVVTAIAPGVIYWKTSDKCFAVESYVSRKMMEDFDQPNFLIENGSSSDSHGDKQLILNRFLEMKSTKGIDFISQKPKSAFAKFCQVEYSRLVHPKMECSFFGDLNHRHLINECKFPNSPFFVSYVEMAKQVWLLHCLAFSFNPQASIFQIRKNSRFSEIYMESVSDEAFVSSEPDPRVAFMVVPGFTISETVIQCQVYLSKCSNT